MIRSIRFTCVLDTNVIIPIEIRDLLFWFAHDDLYIPKWSKHIFDEWEAVMKRKDVSEGEIKKRIGWIERYCQFFTRINLEKEEHINNGMGKTARRSILWGWELERYLCKRMYDK